MTKQTETQTVRCVREVPGEYVTAGETYTMTMPKARKGDVHFRNVERGSGTFMRPYVMRAAMAAGQIIAA